MLVACAVLGTLAVATVARPAARDTITLQMVAVASQQPGYDVLIPNFERVYPDVKVDITYTPTVTQLYQVETSELAAGNGPDIVDTMPGCGTPVGICELGKAGRLAPMTRKPWTRRSLPLVTSLSKIGQVLYAFEPTVGAQGVFTNDDLFRKLGLKVPRTFAQLLTLCAKAKSDGTVALVMDGAGQMDLAYLITNLAIPPVYGVDRHFSAEQRAGTASFDGSPGWRQALQELARMNDAGCFEPGMSGASAAATRAAFAQGQGLMTPGISGFKGVIDADGPQFSYSFHPFPAVTSPEQVGTFLILGFSLSVNAQSSAANQTAAQAFVDFVARPKQNALYAEQVGNVTQYEFLKGQVPGFMSSFDPLFSQGSYVLNPMQSWWSAGVLLALEQDGVGVVTGQSSVDSVLGAMDDAWRQGPS